LRHVGTWRERISSFDCHQHKPPVGFGQASDAGALATRVPAGMLFVPSHRGISHSPLEQTDDRLLVQGCRLLLEAVVARTETH